MNTLAILFAHTHSGTMKTDPIEQARFAALADEWWSARGSLAALHHLNPARLRFIKQAVGTLKDKTVLDIGCGGGVLAEPLTRLGAKVVGVDASPEAISVAKAHAATSNLTIHYHTGTVEDLPPKLKYDVVIASEVIEHTPDPMTFIAAASQRVKPNGLFILTTLNRTFKSWALGVVMAERVLHLAPHDLHDWRKFLKPSEVAALLRSNGLEIEGLSGLRYNPFSQTATLVANDMSINYLLWARKV